MVMPACCNFCTNALDNGVSESALPIATKIFKRVVFPQPLGPSIVKNLFPETFRDTFFNICLSFME